MDHLISSAKISIEQIYELVEKQAKVKLSDEASLKIQNCRDYLDEKVKRNEAPIYGINTGFGHLCNVIIPDDKLEELQRNLLISHACGMGPEVPSFLVKLMLLLKAQSLSYGHSGVQLQTVERLLEFYNKGYSPVVFEQGSLGASGDLAPLAHLTIPLLGMGKMRNSKGELKESESLLKESGLNPIALKSKEGLALINGTQFMASYGVWCIYKAKHLLKIANLIAAMSLDAYQGHISPFHNRIHEVRNQKGQQIVAAAIFDHLEESEFIKQPKEHVQDPYSFRCIPQVHGASLDAITYAEGIITNEINAVTDNPNIFEEEDIVVSGGNFHGQPLALALDFLAIALSEIGNISERRTYKLVNGERDLPSALIEASGLHSGFMIPQYTAASMVSQNKQLCSPASVDSITSSKGQEDHVSMGANAATKCKRVVQNVEGILAIELFAASQAIELQKRRTGLKSSPKIEMLLKEFRKEVSFLDKDRFLHPDMQLSKDFIGQKMREF